MRPHISRKSETEGDEIPLRTRNGFRRPGPTLSVARGEEGEAEAAAAIGRCRRRVGQAIPSHRGQARCVKPQTAIDLGPRPRRLSQLKEAARRRRRKKMRRATRAKKRMTRRTRRRPQATADTRRRWPQCWATREAEAAPAALGSHDLRPGRGPEGLAPTSAQQWPRTPLRTAEGAIEARGWPQRGRG